MDDRVKRVIVINRQGDTRQASTVYEEPGRDVAACRC